MERLTEIRDEIADLKRQRAQLDAAPPPRSALRDRTRAVLTAAAADEGAALQRALRYPARSGGLRLLAPVVSVNGDRADVTGLLAALLGPEKLMTALDKHLAQLPDGPTDAQRAEGLAELDRQVEALENAEEDEIEALEAAGAAVARRPDASPAVVLRADL